MRQISERMASRTPRPAQPLGAVNYTDFVNSVLSVVGAWIGVLLIAGTPGLSHRIAIVTRGAR